ncbi:MAG TPA: hypothetical protein VGB05_03470 [Pyrinomonadaceae bacterium]
MTEHRPGKWHNIALALGVVAGVLALSAALIRYVRSGEIDAAKIAAGIFFPLVVYSLTRRNSSGKQ